jgi:TolA-binding protein
MKNLLAVILLVSLTGCLKTRSEIRGNSSLRTDSTGRYVSGNVNQQQRAQIDSRFFEIDRDFRQLYGKIETLEKQISDMKDKPVAAAAGANPIDSKKMEAIEKRMSTLEEALLAIDKKLSTLTGTKTSKAKARKSKGPFTRGEELYAQGKYEEAVASYDAYRKRYPRGRRYAQATLKMGLCFHKLKMPQDAKAFYQEVIQRFPKTKVSKAAQKNLKSI